jgi:hypothetical protein
LELKRRGCLRAGKEKRHPGCIRARTPLGASTPVYCVLLLRPGTDLDRLGTPPHPASGPVPCMEKAVAGTVQGQLGAGIIQRHAGPHSLEFPGFSQRCFP